MIPGSLFGWLPLLLSIFGAQPGPVGTTVSRLVLEDEIILRVRIQPRPMFPEIVWSEHKSVKCVPIENIRGAVLTGPSQIDFVLANRSRVRAHIDEQCPALDFYGDFYLQPEDDQLCAARDAIHSRMGGSCMIEQFRHLSPKVKR